MTTHVVTEHEAMAIFVIEDDGVETAMWSREDGTVVVGRLTEVIAVDKLVAGLTGRQEEIVGELADLATSTRS